MTGLPAHILEDPALIAVLDAIEADGSHAYLVGGAVRNALLGQPVDDIDIATNALPEQVIGLAKSAGLKPVPTGLDHGTITIVADGRGFEVTTFRRDVETDGRRAVVAFSDSLEEDARRRDFTMNALYADRGGKVIDPVGGVADLKARRLRFVGEPEERIREDYLRILRFFRFFAWYGCEADPQAVAACAALKDGLTRIARERAGAEIKKLLAAPDPVASLRLMAETGVLHQVLPKAKPGILEALVTLEAQEKVAPSWHRRLAALCDGGDSAERLRLSKDEGRKQSNLAEALAGDWSLNEAGYRLGGEAGVDYALLTASHGQQLPDGWQQQIAHAADASLPISAKDLMPPLKGPSVGKGLKAAEDLWLTGGFTTSRTELIATGLRVGKQE